MTVLRGGFSVKKTQKDRKSRDHDWIASALERFERPLVRYAYRLVNDLDRARELVQEAFLRLCQADRAAVEGHEREWLYTVCRNCAFDFLRKARPTLPLNEPEHESPRVRLHADVPETPSALTERHLQTVRIQTLLGELSQDQQEVIRLKFQNGFSYQEISRISGHSVSNVGYLIHTGMKTLRGYLFDGQPAGAKF